MVYSLVHVLQEYRERLKLITTFFWDLMEISWDFQISKDFLEDFWIFLRISKQGVRYGISAVKCPSTDIGRNEISQQILH